MRIAAGGVFLAGALLAGAVQADGLKAGLWQLTTKSQINGADAPPRESKRCLSEADVKVLHMNFLQLIRSNKSYCERVEHELTPQRLKWRLKCTGQLDMNVAGDFVFDTPEHYTATVDSSAAMLGRTLNATHVTIDARRIGECE
jgi:hypothetical protein